MIHLHKQTRDILVTDLLKDTLGLSKFQTLKNKIENPLRQDSLWAEISRLDQCNLQNFMTLQKKITSWTYHYKDAPKISNVEISPYVGRPCNFVPFNYFDLTVVRHL